MRYLSVCSGIESATVAWHGLGWQPVGFSEIEPFPSAVLAHHYPTVPNYGDMTKHETWPITPGTVDLLVGGTPCQSFSVAGLRQGLADPRGNLTLVYLAMVARLRPKWVVWENVPGVLSDRSGAFGACLGGLGQLGYGWAYRILDAQHFGVPQRRRRVFVVGHSGGAWQRAAAVLFEPESLQGVCQPDNRGRTSDADWWRGEKRVLCCIDAGYGSKWGSNQWYANGHVIVSPDGRPRRATPREVERAFGFPDDYTLVPYRGKPACDGPRYKALGNSMAVPCMRWIGERLAAVDKIPMTTCTPH